MRFWRVPLDHDKFTTPHGRIRIIVERCKGCAFCVEYCPREVLKISDGFNRKGYHYPEPVKESACVDCNLCESICPEFAIFSERVTAPEAIPGAGGPAVATGEEGGRA
jgi:2-oxoglutarate ferredoxin oxidoreductase subunit delta